MLQKNSGTLGRSNTNNLVLAILQGVPRHGRDTIMPAFARELSDPQIATPGNYLLKEYGNPNARVTESQVAQLRGNAQDNKLLLLARAGLAAGALVVLLLLGWAVSRSRGHRSGGMR
ncbi:cytochrome c [Acidovorax sp. JHL-9]|uniref:c-type cytochrome n=1 Tax=Acidovorax sp. JHL-9 TaxID=1276756 RepID=UPI000424C863|nr:cytochrome c [Acidovorax sp. JHL-9]